MNEVMRPSREQFRGNPSASILDAVLKSGNGFDADVWHVMDQRDNSLIADQLLHGAGSTKFIYSFRMAGSADLVTGISVIGARHLAYTYGGMKHRLVASAQKIGALFTFTSYPAENMPMAVSCSVIHELADEPDFYQSVVEIADIKKGNTIQMERRELRFEVKRDGTIYERPHYATIAQSKAYRNGVLALIPQDVQLRWKNEMLALGKDDVITSGVLEEKRAGVLRYAAAKAIGLDRQAIEAMTLNEIAGLSDAAREGALPAFVAAAETLGLVRGGAEPATEAKTTLTASKAPAAGKAAPAAKAAPKAETRAPAETAAPVETKPADPKPVQPAATKPATAAPTFEAYLSDEHGEPAAEPNHFTDPVAFAGGLRQAWETAPPDMRAALMEHNADAISEAWTASQAAADLIDELTGDRPDAVLAVPQGSRGSDFAAYIEAAKTRLSRAADLAAVDAWEQANAATYLKFPSSKKLEVQKVIAERRIALKPAAGQTAKTSDPTPDELRSEDFNRATMMKADLLHARDKAAVDRMTSGMVWGTVMARFERDRPELFAQINQALADCLARLSDPGEGPPAGHPANGG